MTPLQAIDFFDTRCDLATTCDVTETAVYWWLKQGWIPYDKQCLIQVEAERLAKKPKGKTRLVASRLDIPAEKRRRHGGNGMSNGVRK